MEDFYIDYAKLDENQKYIIDKEISPDRKFINKKINSNMVVTGTAGSGKSLIAIHKSKQIAAISTSYAIVVFTKTLKKYFKDGFEKDDRTVNPNGIKYGHVDPNKVFHYNQWKKLEPKPIVDYLVVDECQDFSEKEIDELISSGKTCFFFGDTDQTIMTFRGENQDVETTARKLGLKKATELYKNYRLTIENALLAEVVGNVEEEIASKCDRHGEKPDLIKKSTTDAQLDEIIRLIKNKSLSNVGILMPFNTMKSASKAHSIGIVKTNEPTKLSVEYVKDYFINKGVPVEFKYNADLDTEMDLDFHTTNVKVMTWWCAKGLQFKDVFIPNCNIEYGEDKRRALYVAITRVSENLHLLYNDKTSSFFPDDTRYYKQNNIDLSNLF